LEAWALHQLGSLLGSLGVFDRAFHMLETAESIRHALGDQDGADLSGNNLAALEQLAPTVIPEAIEPPRTLAPTPTAPSESTQALEPSEPPVQEPLRPSRLRFRLALLAASVILAVGTVVLRFVIGVGDTANETPGLTVGWEFGDAWNALDHQTWTQQMRIVIEDGDGAYDYFLDDEPVGEVFEIVLPICEGAQGTIRVESADGGSASVDYEFDSPYCR
jgi:hypothetical protein